MFIQSNNIDVFPFSKDRGNKNARLLTEKHLIELASHPIGNDSFVISESYQSKCTFEFVIAGYHFSIKNFDVSSFTGTDVYGTITIENENLKGSDSTSKEALDTSDDEDTYFTGLELSKTAPEQTTDKHTLKLLTQVNVKVDEVVSKMWVIPDESRRTIDGGIIE